MSNYFSLFFLKKAKEQRHGELSEKSPQISSRPVLVESHPESSDFVGLAEAMRLLKVSAPTLRKYAKAGGYCKYRFGVKRTYYRRSELIQFLERGGVVCGKQEGEMQKGGGQ